MIVFICGGAKSGKSHLAQNMAKALAKNRPLYYVATMIPCDSEDREKIRLHTEDRHGMGFETVEQGRDIASVAAVTDPKGVFLLDSVTALLTNEMYGDFENTGADKDAAFRCVHGIESLSRQAADIIIVSDYIFSDGQSYDSDTQLFIKSLAHTGNRIAQISDIVIEMNCGNPTIHKGKQIYETVF